MNNHIVHNIGNARAIASVVVDKALFSFDIAFDYILPENCDVVVGQRVVVPFGKGGKKRVGLIKAIRKDVPDNRLKEIFCLVNDGIILNEEMLSLVDWLKENTFCTYFDAVKTILPGGMALNVSEKYQLNEDFLKNPDSFALTETEKSYAAMLMACQSVKELNDIIEYGFEDGKKQYISKLVEKSVLLVADVIKQRVGDETEKNVRLTDYYLNGEYTENKGKSLTPKQKKVVDFLEDAVSASVKEVIYTCTVTKAVISNLEKTNVVETFDNVISRSLTADAQAVKNIDDIILSDEQNNVYNGLTALMDEEAPRCALLKGVTGSGKTTVFLKLIDKALKSGQTALMLVPEISLTPQMVRNFTDIFGNKVAVIHSNLSLGQRMDEYKRIRDGEATVVIGTRSAVFAPLQNIGVIVIDEEGEHTYKSEKSPRYHARNVAKQRAFYHKATLLLASATPSLDSAYNAEIGKYKLFEMKNRYSRSLLPEVYIVDMKVENELLNRSNFSRVLVDEINENLNKGEQTILLLNRRGYHTYMNCIKCGEVYSCPNCNIPLTYHKHNNSLICHYCEYTEHFSGKCKACGSKFIHSSGTGTQRIEDELEMLFPKARILRMDADTTMSKSSYETNFDKFKKGEYDIMVGTQMIAKGLDFENVTLVGVLMIDKSLYAGDYLGYEKTFSLVTQVVGRCGRGSKKGRAYLQTYTPDHYVLNLAAEQNFDEFYKQETEIRKTLLFPPYCDLCVVGFSAFDDRLCEKGANAFLSLIKKNLEGVNIPIRILGPSKCSVARINGKFRYKIIIKCKNNKQFRAIMFKTLQDAYKSPSLDKVSFYADLNGEIT
ncbi:MAG: primosomal protein N' [Ruminiclostridium sp.]|nr:primosomal protein N' [Ruminiclostridium sp.]